MSRNDRHRPRIYTGPQGNVPTGVTLAADFALLHEFADRQLDPWQLFALEKGLTQSYPPMESRYDWAAREVGVLAGRQNGKTTIAEARELGGAALLGEKVVHTCSSPHFTRHAMSRMVEIITSSPILARQVERMWWATADESIRFRNGATIRYLPRTSRTIEAARNADLLVLDDAIDIDTFWWGLATAKEDPDSPRHRPRQVWYLGTAVDRERHPRGNVFSKIRHRGLTGTDPTLLWLEYSAPDGRDNDGRWLIEPTGPLAFEMGNPSPRLSYEKTRAIHRTLVPGIYETDVLGIGNWFGPLK